MTAVLAWHFVGNMLRDGTPVPDDGVVLWHDGPLVICKSGLHGSERAFDALEYAPGPILCRTEHGGEFDRQSDKLCSTTRKIIARRDASDMMRKFARLCALDVAHLWDMPGIVRQYLETGDEQLRAAAWDAARDAAWDAAWDAARAAAWDAARAAARDAQANRFEIMAMELFA